MAHCLARLRFTEQGIRNDKHTLQRSTDFRAKLESARAKILAQYRATGDADDCIIFESPDYETATGPLASARGVGQRPHADANALQ